MTSRSSSISMYDWLIGVTYIIEMGIKFIVAHDMCDQLALNHRGLVGSTWTTMMENLNNTEKNALHVRLLAAEYILLTM